MRRAVFWDRDGVLTVPVHRGDGIYTAPWDLRELELADGAVAATRAAALLNYDNFVVTNQPDVADGLLCESDLEAMHAFISRVLPLTRVVYCSDRDSPSYKPRPGMLLWLAKCYDVDLSRSWLVGDRHTDVAAAAAAGVRPILLAPSADENLIKLCRNLSSDTVVADSLSAVSTIIGE